MDSRGTVRRRRREPWPQLGVVLVLVLAIACNGGGGESEEGQADEGPSDDQLPDEVCQLLDRFEENRDALATRGVLDLDEAALADGCTTQVGSVDPDGTRVALAQTCNDPLDSGIVVVDLASGDVQRVATGIAALPEWSSDGEWLVFGYSPLGQNNAVGVWLAQPDGDQLRNVVASPAWFPVWLPPG